MGRACVESMRAEGNAMKLLQTQDEGLTLLHPELGESYHPVSGAVRHAEFYAESCKLPARVLDIGFGLGFCAAAVIQKALQEHQKVEIVGVECDSRILEAIEHMPVPVHLGGGYTFVQKAVAPWKVEERGIVISVLRGDARKVVADVSEGFDLIFLDGFSIMKNPELYSQDFLQLLKEKMRPAGILASYSNSVILRGGLRAAGFCMENYQGGTRAGLQQQFSLDEKEERLLRVFGKPLRDPELDWRRERIIEEWGRLPIQNPGKEINCV